MPGSRDCKSAGFRPSVTNLGQVPKKVKSGWKSAGFPGVRFREHPTRKHGRQPDRYYVIRYRFQEKNCDEAVGWASEGVKPSEAFRLLGELKKNQRMGTPPFTMAEKRAMEEAQRQAEAEARHQDQRDRITVKDFFVGDYLKAQTEKKPSSIRREKDLFEMFIGPEIGSRTFKEVAPFNIERIKARMVKTDRSPRTVQYCMAIIRQIFNTARFHGLHDLEAPTRKVKKPKFDNKRVRHLTENEAESLMSALKKKSLKTYMHTVLSLFAGLRFGEIASLTWGDVDLDRGILTLRDTKAGNSRPAFITEKIRAEVFDKLKPGRPAELIFPTINRNGEIVKAVQVSGIFLRTVKELGLNDGIEDPRQKVCFHTCRHTFASWLVERETDLFQVSKLLGHSTIALTERYAHLRPDKLQAAVKVLDQAPDTTVPNVAKAAEAGK